MIIDNDNIKLNSDYLMRIYDALNSYVIITDAQINVSSGYVKNQNYLFDLDYKTYATIKGDITITFNNAIKTKKLYILQNNFNICSVNELYFDVYVYYVDGSIMHVTLPFCSLTPSPPLRLHQINISKDIIAIDIKTNYDLRIGFIAYENIKEVNQINYNAFHDTRLDANTSIFNYFNGGDYTFTINITKKSRLQKILFSTLDGSGYIEVKINNFVVAYAVVDYSYLKETLHKDIEINKILNENDTITINLHVSNASMFFIRALINEEVIA